MPFFRASALVFLMASASPQEAADKRYYLTLLNGAAIEVTEETEVVAEEGGEARLVTRIHSRQKMRIGPRRLASETTVTRIERASDLAPISLETVRIENHVRFVLSVRVHTGEAVIEGTGGTTRLSLPAGRPAYFRLDGQVMRAMGLLRPGSRLEAAVIVPEESGLALMKAKVERRTADGYLLRISNLVGSERAYWYEECDGDGRLLRFHVGGMEKRRVPEDEARLPAVGASISNRVRAENAPADLYRRSRAALRLEGALPEDITLVPSSPYCRIVTQDTSGLTLRLSATYPDGTLPASELADDERESFLARTVLYEVGDAALTDALASALAGRSPITSDLSRLVRICRWVNRRICSPAGMPAMSSAVFAIRARRGDCTEYAAAAIGMLRTAGIPARMALGLVYDGVGFQFHAWAEAHVDDRWVPLDAAYRRVGLPPAYILLGYGDVESGLYENRAFLLLAGFRFRFIADAEDFENGGQPAMMRGRDAKQ